MKDNYKYVSLIYDYIMSDINYKFWAKYIYILSQKYCVNEKKSVLELAAGNGNISKYLYKKFSDYLISDISISMLKQNKIKNAKLVCFDMISPPFKKQFDVILCTFDSINYIVSKKQLENFFKNISRLLSPGGIFLFDATLEKNSLHHQKFALKKGCFKKIRFLRQSIFLQKSRIHKNIFKFYFEDGNIFTEVHRQKIFKLEELIKIINDSSLFIVECFNAFTFNNCKPDNFRAQFVVKGIRKC